MEGNSAAGVQVVLGDQLDVGHQVEYGVEIRKIFAIGEAEHARRIGRRTAVEE